MNTNPPVPTLLHRQALAEYRAKHDELRKPYVGPFVTAYLDALSAAERESLCARGEPVELSSWQLIREEYREHPAQFLAVGLVWAVTLGLGLVAVAVRNGWLS